MRTILAGPRPPLDLRKNPEALEVWYAAHAHFVEQAVDEARAAWGVLVITEEICGKAQGYDTLGERWACKHGIPVKPFYAEWTKLGKRAGRVRNEAMGDYAEALIALVATPPTNGTAHMVWYMGAIGKPVHEFKLPEGV